MQSIFNGFNVVNASCYHPVRLVTNRTQVFWDVRPCVLLHIDVQPFNPRVFSFCSDTDYLWNGLVDTYTFAAHLRMF
jgi:hypothetical protein